MSPPRERRTPTVRQIKTAMQLLTRVPALGKDWNSSDGQAFLAFVAGLAESGVPVTWLANELELDPNRLHNALARHRQSAK